MLKNLTDVSASLQLSNRFDSASDVEYNKLGLLRTSAAELSYYYWRAESDDSAAGHVT